MNAAKIPAPPKVGTERRCQRSSRGLETYPRRTLTRRMPGTRMRLSPNATPKTSQTIDVFKNLLHPIPLVNQRLQPRFLSLWSSIQCILSVQDRIGFITLTCVKVGNFLLDLPAIWVIGD